MGFVAIVRVLWSRRLVLIIGSVAIVVLALTVAASPTSRVGVAKTSLLLDTQRSQLLGGAPVGADTLTWRAQLISELLTSEGAKARIAAAAGIPYEQMHVIEPLLLVPSVPTALPRRALEAATITSEPYVVVVEPDPVLPLISISATAPDRAVAARLATATAESLKTHKVRQTTTELQGFRVESAAAVKTKMHATGGARAKAAGVALLLLALWWALVAVVPARGRFPGGGRVHPV